MNYWCKTCNCHKGPNGADECAADGHAIMPMKDREAKTPHEVCLEIISKLGYGSSAVATINWIVAKVEEERHIFRTQIDQLKKALELKTSQE